MSQENLDPINEAMEVEQHGEDHVNYKKNNSANAKVDNLINTLKAIRNDSTPGSSLIITEDLEIQDTINQEIEGMLHGEGGTEKKAIVLTPEFLQDGAKVNGLIHALLTAKKKLPNRGTSARADVIANYINNNKSS